MPVRRHGGPEAGVRDAIGSTKDGIAPAKGAAGSAKDAIGSAKDAEAWAHDFGNISVHSRPVGIQAKLWVNSPGDSDEKEADKTADKVMRMAGPGTQKACACGGTCSNCSGGSEKDAEKLQTKSVGGGGQTGGAERASSTGRPGEIPAPPLVNEVISSPGQSLDNQTRTFFESRIGYDFGQVRVHTDEKAARSAGMVNALAYTVGKDVVFGPGQYNPGTEGGKRLLAHELTHVMQQRGPASLQRKDGDGLMGGRALTMKWDIQFQKDKPGPAEMGASPSVVLTASGISSLDLVKSSFQMNPQMEAELEGNASVEGPATHNYELSVRRARYIARLIGIGRVRDVPGGEHACPKIETGIYACGATNAKAAVDPADRRVQASLFTPPSETKPSFPMGGPSGSNQGTGNKQPDNTTPDKKPPDGNPPGGKTEEKKDDGFSNQWGFSGAGGYLGHHYLTPRGSNPVNEAIGQLAVAFTRQMHGKNQAGWEKAGVVQLQISKTTGTASLAGGGQLSYVLPFGDNEWAWTNFIQVLLGSPLSLKNPSLQYQPVLGTQLFWQPKDWLQAGVQATYGPTAQTNGPNSLDFNGLVVIQIVK